MKNIRKRVSTFLVALLTLFAIITTTDFKADAEEIDPATLQRGDIIYFGSYQQSLLGKVGEIPPPDGTEGVDWIVDLNANDNKDEYYYAIEPLAWRVIGTESNSELFLVAKNVVDQNKFHTRDDGTRWVNSEARKWLNGTEGSTYLGKGFLGRAFSDAQQRAIKLKTIDNFEPPEYSSGGTQTWDKIFPLSKPEVDALTFDEKRHSNTEYSYSRPSRDGRFYFAPLGQNEWYFTRSQAKNSETGVVYVQPNGNYNDQPGTKTWYFGVVPALYLDLTKVSIISENGEKYAKVYPDVSWPTDLTAVYGQTLADIELPDNGMLTEGVFSWADDTADVGTAGTQEHNMTFTPKHTESYLTVTKDINVEVEKAVPDVIWPTQINASYGQALSDIEITGGSGEGVFSWTNVNDYVGNIGTRYHSMTFTPMDIVNYRTITESVGVTVNKAYISGVNRDLEVGIGAATEYVFDLETLLPNFMNRSGVSYSFSIVSNDDNILNPSLRTASSSALIVSVLSVEDEGKTASMKVTVSSDNYYDFDSYITVRSVNKTVVDISGVTINSGKYNKNLYSYSGTPVFTSTINGDEVLVSSFDVLYTSADNGGYESRSAPFNAGDYNLIISVDRNDPQYTGSKVYGFTIHKKDLTIKADNKTINRGESLPVPTVSYIGFIDDYDEDMAVNIEAVARLNVSDSNTAGTTYIDFEAHAVLYDIFAKNYELNHVNGLLTINDNNQNYVGDSASSVVTKYKNTVKDNVIIADVNEKDGVAKADIDESNIQKAIENTIKEGIKNPSDDEKTTVVIQLDTQGNDKGEITINKKGWERLVKEGFSLRINIGEVILSLDSFAVRNIANQAVSDISVHIGLANKSDLTQNQKETIGENTAYNISIISNQKEISELGGNVKISLPYALKSDESQNGTVIYYVDKNGKSELIKNSVYDSVTELITFMTNHFSLYMISHNSVYFDDIAEEFWGKDAICFAAARDLVRGVGNNKFDPDRAITRAEFIKMMVNAVELPESVSDKDVYSDVLSESWYFDSIIRAKSAGWLNKFTGAEFKPNKAITREEMASVLSVILKDNIPGQDSSSLDLQSTYSDFDDFDSNYLDDIRMVTITKIMQGIGNDKFSPKGVATRAQAVQIQKNLFTIFNSGNQK